MQLKGVFAISPVIVEARKDIYLAVINSTSKHGLEKDQVPEIADKIWDKFVAPLAEEDKVNPILAPYPKKQAR